MRTSNGNACTANLIQNDPTFVEMSLERVGEDFDVSHFADAIHTNRTVRHVCFSGTFVRDLDVSHWRTVLEAVGELETLEELQIWCSTIPMDSFGCTMHRARRLRKVYLFRVTLLGAQNHFDDWAMSIRDHPSLRDYRIGGFQIQATGERSVRLDNVLEAFADAPGMMVVSLQSSVTTTATTNDDGSSGSYGGSIVVPFSCQSLSRLFASSITDLYLSRLGLGHAHLDVIADALAANASLRILDLFGNNVENVHVIRIANALRTNATLETLVLPCPTKDDLSIESCAAISRALQKNRSLMTLTLPRSNLSDDGIQHLVEGLIVNTTVKRIEVGVSKDLGDKGKRALIHMLEHNYDLERLVVSSAEQRIKEKVMFYMRLNEVGRGSLLRDGGKATREQWLEM